MRACPQYRKQIKAGLRRPCHYPGEIRNHANYLAYRMERREHALMYEHSEPDITEFEKAYQYQRTIDESFHS